MDWEHTLRNIHLPTILVPSAIYPLLIQEIAQTNVALKRGCQKKKKEEPNKPCFAVHTLTVKQSFLKILPQKALL